MRKKEISILLNCQQARFWVPLIALYQGCRLNEICQLDTLDIVSKKGIPCFFINSAAKDKSLKNKTSERLIPIHPVLVDLGFLQYVDFQRKSNSKKLFSELNRTERGKYCRSVQAWFARHLDSLGITGSDKVFHSFRHTFETKAIEKEYQQNIKMPLEGGQTEELVNEYMVKQKILM